MAALTQISQPPAYIEADEYARQQQSTPSTFASLHPVLRFRLPNTIIYLSPTPENVLSCFQQIPDSAGDEADDDGHTEVAFITGELFLTEQDLSLLCRDNSSGIKLTYPAIALHALSRSIPSFVTSSLNDTASARSPGCIYCQLDLSGPDSDPDDTSALVEMHIVTPDDATLEQLFDALSQCASLHPSSMLEEDVGEHGHPFAGLVPFGTDASGYRLEDSAFDDASADEEDGFISDIQAPNGADAQELSETGRLLRSLLTTPIRSLDIIADAFLVLPQRNLAHLETVMQWPDSNEFNMSSKALDETNTLILSNLPNEFFIPHICSLLLSLLNTYGPMVRWTPLPSIGRAVVVFQDCVGSRLAKEGLDRLVLPFEDEANGDLSATSANTKVERANYENDGTILRAIYGPLTDPNSEVETLAVPSTDKNFLISPPGSPPIGWEPIREDPPNRDTLADDLMRALADLRDTGSHIASHQPTDWGNGRIISSVSTASNAPEVILAPSTAPPLRDFQPAWLQSRPAPSATVEDAQEEIAVPGVTLQSVDGRDEDEQDASKTYNGYSISSVKATVESMRGTMSSEPASSSGHNLANHRSKITPTSRPPLSDFGQ